MDLHLKIWRQSRADKPGAFVLYDMAGLTPDMSFLEMLDILNNQLIAQGEDPVAFDSDCREGICGTCGIMINGIPHGPQRESTACQLFLRHFKDGDTIIIEPFRAKAFPIVKDLVIDRSSFDRILERGGFISTRTGSAPEANTLPVSKIAAERAMDAAACIGCGACVAACPNASAMLFTAAKISHLGILPQGQPERFQRAHEMVLQMDREGFGGCTNVQECEAVCPKLVSTDFIARMNRDFFVSAVLDSNPAAKE